MIRRLPLLLSAVLLLTAAAADAGQWRAVRNVSGGEPADLQVKENRRAYTLLSDGDAVVLHVRGPRRLRLISRVLPGAGAAGETEYALRLFLDGAESALERHAAAPLDGVELVDDPQAPVGAQRKDYLRVPDGLHEVMVRAETGGAARVALRLFEESRRRREERVSLSPEVYEDVLTLQFESGSQSTYYAFTGAEPLAFRVTGPTTVELWTRLDFDHTMSGRQHYVVDVLVDGESTGLRHYDVDKLDAAAWVERSDVLPGERKTLKLELGRGRHRVEVRCLRPDGCRVAAKVWLPEEDLR